MKAFHIGHDWKLLIQRKSPSQKQSVLFIRDMRSGRFFFHNAFSVYHILSDSEFSQYMSEQERCDDYKLYI